MLNQAHFAGRACAAAALGLLIVACGEQEPAPGPPPPDSPGRNLAAAELQLEGGDVKLPAGFPADVPVFPSAQPTASISTDAEGSFVTFQTEARPKAVFDFYLESLAAQGWTIEQQGSGNGQWVVAGVKGERKTMISIAASEQGTEFGIAAARAE